jgi:hypothetical protein
MEWTKDKPTQEGAYFYFDGDAVWVENVDSEVISGDLIVWFSPNEPRTLDKYKGWWMGPIEKPAPPSEQ